MRRAGGTPRWRALSIAAHVQCCGSGLCMPSAVFTKKKLHIFDSPALCALLRASALAERAAAGPYLGGIPWGHFHEPAGSPGRPHAALEKRRRLQQRHARAAGAQRGKGAGEHAAGPLGARAAAGGLPRIAGRACARPGGRAHWQRRPLPRGQFGPRERLQGVTGSLGRGACSPQGGRRGRLIICGACCSSRLLCFTFVPRYMQHQLHRNPAGLGNTYLRTEPHRSSLHACSDLLALLHGRPTFTHCTASMSRLEPLGWPQLNVQSKVAYKHIRELATFGAAPFASW
jgi:hypothetical protein